MRFTGSLLALALVLAYQAITSVQLPWVAPEDRTESVVVELSLAVTGAHRVQEVASNAPTDEYAVVDTDGGVFPVVGTPLACSSDAGAQPDSERSTQQVTVHEASRVPCSG